MRRIISALIFPILFLGQINAHSGKPDFHVIIDTDGALDDMRSISMLLAESDVRVLAISCSQGSLLPASVYEKVSSLVSTYHHEGIPIGLGENLDVDLPKWSGISQGIAWANEVSPIDIDQKEIAVQLLSKTINYYNKGITLIALGSLKTYADWLKENPEQSEKIERIIWYNNHQLEKGFNYSLSPESFEYIKQTGIKLDIVYNNLKNYFINENYLNKIASLNSIYAKQIDLVHSDTAIVKRIHEKHMQFWDDLIPMYLKAPLFFNTTQENNITNVELIKGLPESIIIETVAGILESGSETNNRVFVNFPIDTSLYKPEYAKILNSTIENYGLVEWKAISMTNEIHGHTGIYSIIGAKMGIRAMELFNVGVNNLEVTTFAGKKPPLSCFNDGIQISSGATIGQGLITISDSIINIPTAIFEFNNQKVSMSVKPEIALQMQNDIKAGIQEYGLLTDGYWIYIEKLALRYWADFDRHDIFKIKVN